MKKAILALEDGTVFEGYSFGAEGETAGEVVFNTSMTGYQEILTDPSYKGQIVTMTYPPIGSYWFNESDAESSRPHLSGLILKELSQYPSNWRSQKSLDAYLRDCGIAGIQGIDTRALTRRLRDHGSQMGIISTGELDPLRLAKRVRTLPGLIGLDTVKEVTCAESFRWINPPNPVATELNSIPAEMGEEKFNGGFRVVVYDFGVKWNILRMLKSSGCEVTVLPASTPAEDVLAMNPDGILLSNGPGDPEGVSYAIGNVKRLIGRKPVFGICLGHQILGLALGGKSYKLRFGHQIGRSHV